MLIDALVEKYGRREGLTLHNDEIFEWPYEDAIPSSEELAILKEEYIAKHEYKLKRISEYPSTEDMIVALWEKIINNDEIQAQALEIKRQEIKDKYPNPTIKNSIENQQ